MPLCWCSSHADSLKCISNLFLAENKLEKNTFIRLLRFNNWNSWTVVNFDLCFNRKNSCWKIMQKVTRNFIFEQIPETYWSCAACLYIFLSKTDRLKEKHFIRFLSKIIVTFWQCFVSFIKSILDQPPNVKLITVFTQFGFGIFNTAYLISS